MLENYTVISSKSFEETITVLKERLMTSGFGTLCSISLNERFAMKQLDYKDQLMILEVCNPFEAFNALNIDKEVIYFLPCKIIVKQSNDVVSASMIRPTAFMSLLGHESLNEFAQKIENSLIEAMNQL